MSLPGALACLASVTVIAYVLAGRWIRDLVDDVLAGPERRARVSRLGRLEALEDRWGRAAAYADAMARTLDEIRALPTVEPRRRWLV